MYSTSAELEARGHQVSYLFRERLAPTLRYGGIRRLVVPWLILGHVVAAGRAGRRYDVVELHAPMSAPYALAARLAGRRLPALVLMTYGLDERNWESHLYNMRRHRRPVALKSRILFPLTLLTQTRLGMLNADAILLSSSEDGDYLVDRLGVPRDRITPCFSGVSEDFFDVPRHEPGAEMRVLFLGSWLERKGILELADAWRRLEQEQPGVSLTIAGAGNGDRARADMGGLSRVDIVDEFQRDELPGLLMTHDVFVLPSWFEGMSLAMLEAAAAGLACLVTGVCGSLDVFRRADPGADGGVLVPPGDSDALFEALRSLADDPGLRWELGTNARERARRFTWATTADRALHAYRSAIARRREIGS